MKALQHTWLSTRGGCIGVVLAENNYGQKAFITVVSGHDEQQDIQHVMDWGSSLSLSQAKGFFGDHVDDEKYGNI
jgi:hypothetical protein